LIHFVLRGEGEITAGDAAPIPVRAGSVVIVPAFAPHILHGHGAGAPPLPECRPLDLGLKHLRAGDETGADDSGGGYEGLVALCGRLDIGLRGLGASVRLLREPLVAHLSPDDRVRHLLDDLIAELVTPDTGSRALSRALMVECFIRLLRRRHSAGDANLRWIEGLADPRLWPALQAMMDRPEAPHSVDSLAAAAGTSRSVFAETFSRIYGKGPMEMLREIRLQRAADLLTRTDWPVKRIAERVGYASRSHFSGAFEARFDARPEAFRKQLDAGDRDSSTG
jgi:AraC-like DNA-binding protein